MDEKKKLNNTFENTQNSADNNNHSNNNMNYDNQNNQNNYSGTNYNNRPNSINQNNNINYNNQNNYNNTNYNNRPQNSNINPNNNTNYSNQNNYNNANYNNRPQNSNINPNNNLNYGNQNNYNNQNNPNYNNNYNVPSNNLKNNQNYNNYGNQNNNINYNNGDNQNYYNNENNLNQNDQVDNSKDEKGGKRNIFIILGIVVAVIGYYVATNYIFLEKFNISDYYTVKIDGLSGAATAEILTETEPKENSKNKTNPKIKNFLEKANIKLEISKKADIQNGEVITVNAKYDNNLAKKNKIKVINDTFEINVKGLPTIAKDVSGIKNLSQIKETYGNSLLEELMRRNDYISKETVGMYTKKDQNGNAVLVIYNKAKDSSYCYYYYMELSNLVQNQNNEIISVGNTSVGLNSNIRGEVSPQELDNQLKLEDLTKVN